MSDNVTAIKGFADLFSPESDAFTHMEAVARDTFSRYGFTELRTPILERTELFCRGIGTETDVVQVNADAALLDGMENGMTVTVYSNGAMTMSLPGQISAEKIVKAE